MAQPSLEEARKLYFAGDYQRAIPICRRLLKSRKNDPDVLFVLGACEVSASMFEEGYEHVRQAIRKRPTDPHFYRPLSTVHLMFGRLDEAHAALDRALSFNANFAPALADKAELYLLENRIDDARAIIEPLFASNPKNGRVVATYARLCRIDGDDEKGARVIEEFLRTPGLQPSQTIGPLFRLALHYDKLGRHEECFKTLQRANAMVHTRYDPGRTRRIVTEAEENWDASAVADLDEPALPEPASRTPVFIVGMPRSGTSLVEQIVATHPDVEGAGELDLVNRQAAAVQVGAAVPDKSVVTDPSLLNQNALTRAAEGYLGGVERFTITRASLVSDKLPTNFLNLGFIHAMFPGAPVIHCRRDPLDTILSCYSQHFAGNVPFAYDLEHLGAFYREYERLMAHWSSVLGGRRLDVDYERLAADPEPEIRKLIDFLGLKWDDRCLEFHKTDRVTRTASNEQVRRPMYTSSIGRWKKYESFLGPAKRALGMDESE